MEEMPKNFASLEDMQKFLDKVGAGKAKVSEIPTGQKPKSKRSRNRKSETDSSRKMEVPVTVPIYKTIHFYVRPGDTWDQVLKDGREETNYQGAGTFVFCHNHLHSEDCNDSCRRVGP